MAEQVNQRELHLEIAFTALRLNANRMQSCDIMGSLALAPAAELSTAKSLLWFCIACFLAAILHLFTFLRDKSNLYFFIVRSKSILSDGHGGGSQKRELHLNIYHVFSSVPHQLRPSGSMVFDLIGARICTSTFYLFIYSFLSPSAMWVVFPTPSVVLLP